MRKVSLGIFLFLTLNTALQAGQQVWTSPDRWGEQRLFWADEQRIRTVSVESFLRRMQRQLQALENTNDEWAIFNSDLINNLGKMLTGGDVAFDGSVPPFIWQWLPSAKENLGSQRFVYAVQVPLVRLLTELYPATQKVEPEQHTRGLQASRPSACLKGKK